MDSKFAEEWLWRRGYGKLYWKVTNAWALKVSMKWHRRFHS